MRDSFISLGSQMLPSTAHCRVYWDKKLKGSFCQAWPTPRQVFRQSRQATIVAWPVSWPVAWPVAWPAAWPAAWPVAWPAAWPVAWPKFHLS